MNNTSSHEPRSEASRAERSQGQSFRVDQAVSQPLGHLVSSSENLKSVAPAAAVAFVVNIAGAGFNFLLSVALSRLLGAAGAGVFFLSLTAAQIAAVFGRSGMDSALLRFVATGYVAADWSSVRGVYRAAFFTAGPLAIGAGGVLLLLSHTLTDRVFHKPELLLPLRIMALAVPGLVISFLHGEALKPLNRVAHSQWIQSAAIPFGTLVGVVLLRGRYGATGAVAAYVAASLLAMSWGILAWWAFTPHLRTYPPRFQVRDLLRVSMPLFWVSSLTLALGWISTLSLGIWSSASAVGVFSIAARTALVSGLVLTSVNSVIAPRFAALFAQGRISELAQLARSSTVMVAAVGSPVLALFILFPRWILHLFGAEFATGATALLILAGAQVVNIGTGSVGYLLIMSGHERKLRNTLAGAAIVALAANLILVPKFGVVGAAEATALAIVFVNGCNAWLVRRELGFYTIPFFTPGGLRIPRAAKRNI